MSDQYAVIGYPIGHSKSPQIHSLFAQQTGQDLTYTALCVAPGQFVAAVRDFQAAGGRGLNVTVPFKAEAFALADTLSDRARRAGAVNTLRFEPTGDIFGDNTDGVGLVRDLTVNHGYRITEQRVLLLGAGGAARGVLQRLLQERPMCLWIANRTAQKAIDLAETFEDVGPVFGCGLNALGNQQFDLVIQATSASLHHSMDDVLPLLSDVLAPEVWCYDLMYGQEPTAFLRWARTRGATQTLDGLGMLVEQAAQSFLLWRGVLPETRPVITTLLAERGQHAA